MSNELKYVVEKTKDKTWKGFDAVRSDMQNYEPGRYMIKISKYRRSRSNKQNAYYWGCVVTQVADGMANMGFDKHLLNSENVHHMLREKFLKEEIGIPDGIHAGEFVTMVKSTTDLSTTDMMDYIAAIQQWAAEFLNIVIPDPGEQSELNY